MDAKLRLEDIRLLLVLVCVRLPELHRDSEELVGIDEFVESLNFEAISAAWTLEFITEMWEYWLLLETGIWIFLSRANSLDLDSGSNFHDLEARTHW